jgi:hypothetical protein
MEAQVPKQFYNFSEYCNMERWSSYWHQVNELLRIKPRSILEFGAGDKLVELYFKNKTDIAYKSADIDNELRPDIIASIDKNDIPDSSFDAVCAFEVLEHLPFEKFAIALGEMKRIAKSYILISLPHWGRHFSIDIRLPLVKRLKFQIKIPASAPSHKFNGQHYWEIGKKDFPVKRIISEIESTGLEIQKDFVLFESPYHHFFVLKK